MSTQPHNVVISPFWDGILKIYSEKRGGKKPKQSHRVFRDFNNHRNKSIRKDTLYYT